MNAPNLKEWRRKLSSYVVEIGLAGSLLLALIVVQVIDRLHSVSNPDKVTALDLVFILDQRPAMKDFTEAMKSNCLERAEAFKSSGIDCRCAVIPFGPPRKRFPTVPLTADLAMFKQRLMALPAAGDVPKAASCVAALEQALALDFRKDTQVLFYMISRTPCQDENEVAAIAGRVADRGILVCIQADASEKDRCRSLYQNGGRFFAMDGTDLTGPSVASDKSNRTSKRAESLLSSLAPDSTSRNSSLALSAKGLFSLRTAPNRDELIASMGGSLESEAAVAAGLAWLARHQADDGSWSDPKKCESQEPCQRVNYPAAIAETGLAILAFQAGGNYSFNDQKYSENVKRGLDWLVQQQKPDGRLFGATATWYEHGMATFALAEACTVALANNQKPDPRYRSAAERAIKFTESHQYAQGGWRYSEVEQGFGDTSVTGWQVLSLKSAQEAEIELSPETLKRVQSFFEALGDPATGHTGYTSRGFASDAMTAVGMIFQEFILKQPKSPLALKAAEYLKTRASALGQQGDFYTLYNCTLAMFLAQGDARKQWNLGVRDAVVKRQVKSGCARGSWTDGYGRTLGTSWAVLTLEVYYRYATEDEDEDEPDPPTTK